jgi:hypothetical protein
MAQEVSVIVSGDDRARLEAIVRDRNHSHKHMQRARIVLLAAERLAVSAVARRAGVSRPAVLPGWPATRAGPSTSRRPRAPG